MSVQHSRWGRKTARLGEAGGWRRSGCCSLYLIDGAAVAGRGPPLLKPNFIGGGVQQRGVGLCVQCSGVVGVV